MTAEMRGKSGGRKAKRKSIKPERKAIRWIRRKRWRKWTGGEKTLIPGEACTKRFAAARRKPAKTAPALNIRGGAVFSPRNRPAL